LTIPLHIIYEIQCGTEDAMAAVGRDIREHHLQSPSYTTEANGGSHRPSQQINVILAAPCYAFGGYAGLHLPLDSFVDDSIVIHSTPCVLRYVCAVLSDAQGIYSRDREPTRVRVVQDGARAVL
jgi:hypothetical protein